MDAGDPHNPMPERDRTVTPLVVVLAALSLVAVGALDTLLLVGDDDDARDAGSVMSGAPAGRERTRSTTSSPSTGSPTSTSAGSTPRSSPPSSAASAALPEALVGSWEGTVDQESSQTTYTVEITLSDRPDAAGRIGTVSYPTLECSGYYTLDEVEDDGVTVVEHITEGTGNCLDDVEITLAVVDADHVTYSFPREDDPEDGVGTLTRTG
jgi:hypothetical protein